MHTETVYCGKNIFNRGENQFENESEKYYFFYIKNSVRDLNLFCSRSVLVLNIKTFHVLVLFLFENKNMFAKNMRVLSSLVRFDKLRSILVDQGSI